MTTALEQSLRSMASDFASQLVALTAQHLASTLSSFDPAQPAGQSAPAYLAFPVPAQRPSSVPPPARGRKGAKPEDFVEPLVEIVKRHPWPPRARELRALLGLPKGRFLRTVSLAIAAGRIKRTGFKSSVQYQAVEDN